MLLVRHATAHTIDLIAIMAASFVATWLIFAVTTNSASTPAFLVRLISR
jgi:hypothetical protein